MCCVISRFYSRLLEAAGGCWGLLEAAGGCWGLLLDTQLVVALFFGMQQRPP